MFSTVIEPWTPHQLVVVPPLCYGCMYQVLDTCICSKVVEGPPVAAESRLRSPWIKTPDFIMIEMSCEGSPIRVPCVFHAASYFALWCSPDRRTIDRHAGPLGSSRASVVSFSFTLGATTLPRYTYTCPKP